LGIPQLNCHTVAVSQPLTRSEMMVFRIFRVSSK
jgi:hypothetical protein